MGKLIYQAETHEWRFIIDSTISNTITDRETYDMKLLLRGIQAGNNPILVIEEEEGIDPLERPKFKLLKHHADSLTPGPYVYQVWIASEVEENHRLIEEGTFVVSKSLY